ncbi:uncharacterized protein LOC133353394 [Lethenteron reissneri]|uniref:uncharacterized protein LOC133353394 n=1 Tax=Lethenteron reissneri TaxID=7753 RepID=UPI002AB5F1D4|nr:uncharacterized protein LOC133353394 [Lethenteron reissneri]
MLYHLVTVLSLVALTRGAESGDWNYNVTVYTGTETAAGTDANVRIWIYGDDDAENIILSHSTRYQNAFENGQVDEFLLKLHPLGRIKSIKVGNDGSHSFSGWSFKQLVIKERSSGCTTMFVCECWINGQEKELFPKEVTSCETETNHTATTDVTTVFTKVHSHDTRYPTEKPSQTLHTVKPSSNPNTQPVTGVNELVLGGIVVAGVILLLIFIAVIIVKKRNEMADKEVAGKSDGDQCVYANLEMMPSSSIPRPVSTNSTTYATVTDSRVQDEGVVYAEVTTDRFTGAPRESTEPNGPSTVYSEVQAHRP